MSSIRGRYDGELQMFAEKPRGLSLGKLRFFRWLVEQGKLLGDGAIWQSVMSGELREQQEREDLDKGGGIKVTVALEVRNRFAEVIAERQGKKHA